MRRLLSVPVKETMKKVGESAGYSLHSALQHVTPGAP